MLLSFKKLTGLLLFALCLSLTSFAVAAEDWTVLGDAPGTITGKIVTKDGSPLTSGFVAFFKSDKLDPMDYGNTRRSPTMVAFLDDKGGFTTSQMPAGTYYVGAMPRDKWTGGPPMRGEKRYSAFDDKGKYLVVTLARAQSLDIGTVKVLEPENSPELTDFFTVQGKIVDEKGKGWPGAVVVVKRNYEEAKSDFISEPTKQDGSYQIKLPPGKYFVLAREAIVKTGRPNPNSAMGELGQNQPIGIGGQRDSPPVFILGESGKLLQDVNITMFKVPVPEVKRAEVEAKVKSNQMDKTSLPEKLPLSKRRVDSGAAASQYLSEKTEKAAPVEKTEKVEKPAPAPAAK